MKRQPEGPPPPPVVQRMRLRYAKRGPLRFTSHRDIARALERALRRGRVPMAFSAGFSPHPKISYAGAAPTGVASEAEYFEIGLAQVSDPDEVRLALDAALPPGLDVLTAVVIGAGGPSLADRLEASRWSIELAGVSEAEAAAAVRTLLACDTAPVEKLTKSGTRTVDVKAALVAAEVVHDSVATESPVGPAGSVAAGEGRGCATMMVVVRHLAPAVRPDDVMTALRSVAGLMPPVTPRVTRLAQGQLAEDPAGTAPLLLDPLAHHPAASEPAAHDAAEVRTASHP